MGGELDFMNVVSHSLGHLMNAQPSKPKRMLVFTGGPMSCLPEVAESFGKLFKEIGVAVDVVNFCLEKGPTYSKMLLKSFVTAANKNCNSRLKRIPPKSSIYIRHYLSKRPAIITRASIEQGEIAAAAAAARNKKAKDPKGKNQAPAHDEYVKARGMGMECGKHNPLRNKFKALSLDNEKVKLGKGKMVDGCCLIHDRCELYR